VPATALRCAVRLCNTMAVTMISSNRRKRDIPASCQSGPLLALSHALFYLNLQNESGCRLAPPPHHTAHSHASLAIRAVAYRCGEVRRIHRSGVFGVVRGAVVCGGGQFALPAHPSPGRYQYLCTHFFLSPLFSDSNSEFCFFSLRCTQMHRLQCSVNRVPRLT
jgi:hypothetical protein